MEIITTTVLGIRLQWVLRNRAVHSLLVPAVVVVQFSGRIIISEDVVDSVVPRPMEYSEAGAVRSEGTATSGVSEEVVVLAEECGRQDRMNMILYLGFFLISRSRCSTY